MINDCYHDRFSKISKIQNGERKIKEFTGFSETDFLEDFEVADYKIDVTFLK